MRFIGEIAWCGLDVYESEWFTLVCGLEGFCEVLVSCAGSVRSVLLTCGARSPFAVRDEAAHRSLRSLTVLIKYASTRLSSRA